MTGFTKVRWEQWNGKPSRYELKIIHMKNLGIYWLKMTEEKKTHELMTDSRYTIHPYVAVKGQLLPWQMGMGEAMLKKGSKY